MNWQADFWAKAIDLLPPIPPLAQIEVKKGVTADMAFARSNQEPPASALDIDRYANWELEWVAV